MATTTEISTKVLQYLVRLQAGQTANADDVTLITDAYNSLYLILRDNHSVNWGPDDDIPQEFELPIVMILGNQGPVCKAFGRPVDMNDLLLGERMLKQSLAIDNNYQPAQMQSF